MARASSILGFLLLMQLAALYAIINFAWPQWNRSTCSCQNTERITAQNNNKLSLVNSKRVLDESKRDFVLRHQESTQCPPVPECPPAPSFPEPNTQELCAQLMQEKEIINWTTVDKSLCPGLSQQGKKHGWMTCPPKVKSGCLVYGFGVGAFADWDFAMIQNYNCEVHAFDPTPTASKYINSIKDLIPTNFHYHEYGIGIRDGCLAVHKPLENNDQYSQLHVSQRNSQETIEIPVYTVASIMNLLNHSYVDVIKIDVEGGEFEIIDEMIMSGVLSSVDQLMFEFHNFHIDKETGSSLQLDRMVLQLDGFGFSAIHSTKPRSYLGNTLIEYTFVKRPKFASKPRKLQNPPPQVVCNESEKVRPLDPTKTVSNLLRQHQITCVVERLVAGVPKGISMVDVGSFDGKEAIALAKEGYKVYSFEAAPSKIPGIRASLEAAGVSNFVELRNAAVTNFTGVVNFYTIKNQADSLGQKNAIPGSKKIAVDAVRLDDVVKERIALLKTDTQGFDLQVLKGARYLIQQYGVDRILLEFWPFGIRNSGHDPLELLELLHSLGYKCYDCHKASYEQKLGFPPLSRPNDFKGFVDSFVEQMWVNLLCEKLQ